MLHAPPASHRITESLTSPRPAVLGPVQDGFFAQRAIAIDYGTGRERTTRVVEPHYLLLAWPAWYLLVWDHLRDAIRTLRLDRIESARLTDRTFQLREADSMILVARELRFRIARLFNRTDQPRRPHTLRSRAHSASRALAHARARLPRLTCRLARPAALWLPAPRGARPTHARSRLSCRGQ
jgi:predicted DNA-binding transcriptional regulator YafY